VDPIPDPLLLRISGSAGNRTRTSGSVARNSNHWTTEVSVHNMDKNKTGPPNGGSFLSSLHLQSPRQVNGPRFAVTRQVGKEFFPSRYDSNSVHSEKGESTARGPNQYGRHRRTEGHSIH
jgi:hypothetical protein